jgi:hypothetical protein
MTFPSLSVPVMLVSHTPTGIGSCAGARRIHMKLFMHVGSCIQLASYTATSSVITPPDMQPPYRYRVHVRASCTRIPVGPATWGRLSRSATSKGDGAMGARERERDVDSLRSRIQNRAACVNHMYKDIVDLHQPYTGRYWRPGGRPTTMPAPHTLVWFATTRLIHTAAVHIRSTFHAAFAEPCPPSTPKALHVTALLLPPNRPIAQQPKPHCK